MGLPGLFKVELYLYHNVNVMHGGDNFEIRHTYVNWTKFKVNYSGDGGLDRKMLDPKGVTNPAVAVATV